jgi:hypothetical protein
MLSPLSQAGSAAGLSYDHQIDWATPHSQFSEDPDGSFFGLVKPWVFRIAALQTAVAFTNLRFLFLMPMPRAISDQSGSYPAAVK